MKRYPVLVKKKHETDHQPRNLKIQKLVDEIDNDDNSTSRSYAFQISQKVLNESINPPNYPKIQTLIVEIMNGNDQEMQILPKKSVLSVAQEKTLPPPPPPPLPLPLPPPPSETVVDAVFQELAAAGSPTPTEEEKVGYSDEYSDDETSDKASTDNSSDDESKHDDVESEDEIKLLPATVDGLGKLWKEFMREEKHEHRNKISSILDELLRQDAITRDEYKQLNTLLAESLNEEMDLGPPPEEEDELKKVIHATAYNVIESDKK